ncbi:MAG: hypothetical protein RL653_4329 [Pseudomonadota bacterium]|jgi:hypothetical protein
MDVPGLDTRAMCWGDRLLVGACGLVAGWLWTFGAWVPGALGAALTWTALAAGVPVLRWLSTRPGARWAETVAAFWPAPVLVLGHDHFGPVVDGINPGLRDVMLARWDLLLFGGIPSVFTEHRVPGPVMDVLLVCYYSYFLWPLVVGGAIYRANRSAYAEYRLAMVVFFILNFSLYVAVPAIGPRFFYAGLYQAPLQGGGLTAWLDGLMRVTSFNRDCFPSGHTGFTLVVLVYAALYARRVFWVMLPVATGLVAATVLARFHYGVDLLCALPAVAVAVLSAATVARPGTWSVPRRAGAWWRSVEQDAARR